MYNLHTYYQLVMNRVSIAPSMVTDEERRQWVLNDEGLYTEWQNSGLEDVHDYIKYNHEFIDTVIKNIRSHKKQPHYLKYGQKEVETINYTLDDLMSEGKAKSAGFTEGDADPEQLKLGIEVEKEHTSNIEVAKKIALDHLVEFKNSKIGYYTALKEMESKLESNKQSE